MIMTNKSLRVNSFCLGQNETFSIVCGYVLLLGPDTAAGPAGALHDVGLLLNAAPAVVFGRGNSAVIPVR